jgi:hypothetical protein
VQPIQPSQLSPSQLGHNQLGHNQSGPPNPMPPIRSVPGGRPGARPGRGGVQPEAEAEEVDTTAIRTRREPFGPVTRSQAIIDLSARKRPRNPYSG